MPRDPFLRPGAPEQGPAGRRRRRRLLARCRRPASAAAVALLVVLSLRALSPAPGPADAEADAGPRPVTAGAPDLPADRVLVTVVPAQAAVLQLAVPGRRVDVYAVPTWATGAPEPARRVAREALVVPVPSQDPPGSTGVAPLQPSASDALALAVRHSEARLIAAAQGQAMTVAVLPGP